MKTLIILLTLGLSACGSNVPTASDAPSLALVNANSTYTYKVSGVGITFAAGVYSNFGAGDQLNTNTGNITIPDGNSVDVSIYGLNTVGDIAYNAGAGTLTIELYKEGVMVDSKTISSSGNSAHFNFDI